MREWDKLLKENRGYDHKEVKDKLTKILDKI